MSKKKNYDGIVYSTDPGFKLAGDEHAEVVTPDPSQQNLAIRLDTKHRSGKAVTLIEHFIGTEEDLDKLGRQLKAFCGTGGSVKDGQIIIQGDHRDKVLQWLLKNGYKKSRK